MFIGRVSKMSTLLKSLFSKTVHEGGGGVKIGPHGFCMPPKMVKE